MPWLPGCLLSGCVLNYLNSDCWWFCVILVLWTQVELNHTTSQIAVLKMCMSMLSQLEWKEDMYTFLIQVFSERWIDIETYILCPHSAAVLCALLYFVIPYVHPHISSELQAKRWGVHPYMCCVVTNDLLKQVLLLVFKKHQLPVVCSSVAVTPSNCHAIFFKYHKNENGNSAFSVSLFGSLFCPAEQCYQ